MFFFRFLQKVLIHNVPVKMVKNHQTILYYFFAYFDMISRLHYLSQFLCTFYNHVYMYYKLILFVVELFCQFSQEKVLCKYYIHFLNILQ